MGSEPAFDLYYLGLGLGKLRDPVRLSRSVPDRLSFSTPKIFDDLCNPLLQVDTGLIAEDGCDFSDIGLLVADILFFNRVFDKFWLDVGAEDMVYGVHQVDQVERFGGADVKDFRSQWRRVVHSQRHALDHVHNVGEVAGLGAVAVDDGLLPSHHAPDELTDQIRKLTFVLFVRTVDGHKTEAHDIHFGMDAVIAIGHFLHEVFGDGVVVGGCNVLIFGEGDGVVAIDGGGGGVEHTAHVGGLCEFEHLKEGLGAVAVGGDEVRCEHGLGGGAGEVDDGVKMT